jgi:hypothetical protein
LGDPRETYQFSNTDHGGAHEDFNPDLTIAFLVAHNTSRAFILLLPRAQQYPFPGHSQCTAMADN